MIRRYTGPERRTCNPQTRYRVKRLVGRLHVGDIDHAAAAIQMRDMLLNDETVARIINAVPHAIDWERP